MVRRAAAAPGRRDADATSATFALPSASPPRPMCRSSVAARVWALPHVVPFYDLAESFRHLHPLSNGWFAPPLTADEREQAPRRFWQRWDDDTSRAHHLQFLAWRRLREEWTFERGAGAECSTVFHPGNRWRALHDDEILLDAGAHHGSVTETFLEQTEGTIPPDRRHRARPAKPRAAAGDAAAPGCRTIRASRCSTARWRERDGDGAVP